MARFERVGYHGAVSAVMIDGLSRPVEPCPSAGDAMGGFPV
ncbi:MAG: hypothetical protein AAFV69_00360 [Pseudomonadota bacterium]